MGHATDHHVPWWWSCRLWLAFIGFFGFVHAFAQRVCMSVAIICMVNQTALQLKNSRPQANLTWTEWQNRTQETFSDCQSINTNEERSFTDGPLEWDKGVQGHVHSAFFYGYLVSQVPAGVLAEKFGGKWVLAGCMLLSTLATLISPVTATFNFVLFLVARGLVGVGSGAMFPAMHNIWSHWAPPNERSTLTSLTYAGAWMGNVITLPFSGLMCRRGPIGGWPSIFYFIGGSSAVWLILWSVLVFDTPAKNPRISAVERDYITRSLHGQVAKNPAKKKRMPWLRMLTSLPVWATVIAGFTSDWGLYTFLTNIPTYLHEVLHLDVQSNGLYSALPFLVLWGNMNVSPLVADRLLASGYLSTGAVRKLFHCIGAVGAAAFLLALSFVDCRHPALAISLLTLGVAITAASYSGYFINMMDFAPKYAGTLVGFANSLAACSGFIAPYVAAALTTSRTQAEWQHVFFVAAGVYCAGAMIFCILGSGELQSWADDAADDEMTNDVEGKCENSHGILTSDSLKPATSEITYNFQVNGTTRPIPLS